MYHAKRSGEDRCQSFAAGMSAMGRPEREHRSAQRESGPAGAHEAGR